MQRESFLVHPQLDEIDHDRDDEDSTTGPHENKAKRVGDLMDPRFCGNQPNEKKKCPECNDSPSSNLEEGEDGAELVFHGT